MLVEEVAEGGDVLAEHIRRDPAFTRGMTRVCEGGGVALYKRQSMQHAKFKMQTAPGDQSK
jgi:acetamidase/formamidase